jgi:putative tricarboxylic transport membrane protein
VSEPSSIAGPRWPTQVAIGLGLGVIAALIWVDALRFSVGPVVGVGPSAAMRLVAAFTAVLGVAHLVAAWRQWRGAPRGIAPDRGNRTSLAWVAAAFAGLMVGVHFGAGFIVPSTWLFVGTARAFGERRWVRSTAIGLALTTLAYLFFSRVLALTLPAGPLERLFG